MVAVVVVHGLETVDVEFAEVVLGDHGQADALVAVRLLLGWSLGLLLGNLQLRGIKVHELGLDVFLGRLRLDGSSLLLGLRLLLSRLLRGRCGLGDLLLELTKTKRGRVGAEIVEERREGRVAKEGLNEATVALVLLEKCGVFAAEVVGVLSLESDLAFQLANVFCEMLVSVFE